MSVADPVIDRIDATGSPRLIYLRAGVRSYHPVDDIYKEVRALRAADEALRAHDLFVGAGGNVKKLADGSRRTPRYAVFYDTKVVPDDADHDLTVTGEQLFAPGLGLEPTGTGAACIDKSPLSPGTDVNVDYQPAEAEVIVVQGSGGGGMSAEIEAAIRAQSFDGSRVHISALEGRAGTAFPRGTPTDPVDNFADAQVIAAAQNLRSFQVEGDMVLPAGANFDRHTFYGLGPVTSRIEMAGNALDRSQFYACYMKGTQRGLLIYDECRIDGVSEFNGFAKDCYIAGPIIAAVDATLVGFFNCRSVVAAPARPLVDLSLCDVNAEFRGWTGGLTIAGLDTERSVTIDMFSGVVEIDTSCTAGYIEVRGICKLIDNSGPGCTVEKLRIDPDDMEAIWRNARMIPALA